jgi:hypothetical protein
MLDSLKEEPQTMRRCQRAGSAFSSVIRALQNGVGRAVDEGVLEDVGGLDQLKKYGGSGSP